MSFLFTGGPHLNGKSSLVANQLHIIHQLKQKYGPSNIAEDTEHSSIISLQKQVLPDLHTNKQQTIYFSPNSRNIQPNINQEDDILKQQETTKQYMFKARHQSPQPIKYTQQQQVNLIKSQINSEDGYQMYNHKIQFQQQCKLNLNQDKLVAESDSSITLLPQQISNKQLSFPININNYSQKYQYIKTEPELSSTERELKQTQNVSSLPKTKTIGKISSLESPLNTIEEKQVYNIQQKFINEIKEFSNVWESIELTQTKIEIFIHLLKTLVMEVKRLQPIRQICLIAIELLEENLFCKDNFFLNKFSKNYQVKKNIRESSLQASGADDNVTFSQAEKRIYPTVKNKCDQRLYSLLFDQIQQDHQQAVQFYQNNVVSLKYQVNNEVQNKLELESVIQHLQSRVKILLMKNKELQHYIELAEQLNQNNQTNIKNILDQQQNQIQQMEKCHMEQVKGLQNQIVQMIKQSIEDSKTITAQQLQQTTADDSKKSIIIDKNDESLLISQQQKIHDIEVINLELSTQNNQLLLTINDLSSQLGFLKEKNVIMQQQIDYINQGQEMHGLASEELPVGQNQTLDKNNNSDQRKKTVNFLSSPRQQKQQMHDNIPLEQLN